MAVNGAYTGRREERAERIVRIVRAMMMDETLRAGSYGWTSLVAEKMGVGLATASRDLKLARAVLAEFKKRHGREFNPERDSILWSPDMSCFGFRVEGEPAPLEADLPFLFTTGR